MNSDQICNPSVAVTWRELLALRRIGIMGTVSPPTESELEDMRILREQRAEQKAADIKDRQTEAAKAALDEFVFDTTKE